MKLYLQKIRSYEFGNESDFAAMEAKYHHVCIRKYINKARDAKNSEKSNLLSEEKAKSVPLNHLIAFVNKCVAREV